MHHHRRFGAAVVLLVPLLLGAPAKAAEPTVLGVNAFPNAKALPLHAGIAKGFFERRGLRIELELTEGAQAQREGFAAGKFQIVHSAIDNAVFNIEVRKLDNVILSGGDSGMNEFYAQKGINSFADLRGRSIVVDAPDTAYALQARKIMLQHGLKEGDYTINPVGAATFRFKAMAENKDNAAAILNLPFNLQAEQIGMKNLGLLTDLLGPYQGAGAYAMRGWAERNRATLERYLAAYIEALRFVRDPANRTETIALLMEKLSLPRQIAERTYELLLDPAFGFTPDARFDRQGFRNMMALRAELEGKTTAAPERYLDFSYYEHAMMMVAGK